ncbi:hypothetical protein VTI74DRAFT_9496 [Chaetomium olivicolor]
MSGGTIDPKARFYREFHSSVENIQQQIDQLPNFSAAGGERLDAVEHILGAISRLSVVVADAADFTPAYDQRTYAETIKKLREQVDTAVASFKTKSRFQFKPRASPAAAAGSVPTKPDTRRLDLAANAAAGNEATSTISSSSPKAVAEEKDNVGSLPTFSNTASATTRDYNAEIAAARPGLMGPRKPSFSAARDIALSDHSRVHIILPASAARATSAGTLTHLNQCVVDMSVPTKSGDGGAPFASLALKEIAGSAIVAGHVDGPVHITRVRNSVVMVAARQVRIHDCENVVFYLHCVSRPIVEGCKGVRFARAPESYLTDKEKAETNMFDQVDDFNWLKATPSPHWSLLPESEAIPEEVWRKELASGPGVVIDDTLRSLGVGKATRESG